MSAIRNFVFDWSGTLIDDLNLAWEATNQVLLHARKPALSLEQFRAEFYLPPEEFFGRNTPKVPLPEVGRIFQAALLQAGAPQPIPHALPFLEYCRAHRFRTLLVSAIPQAHYAAIVADSGWDRFFDHAYLNINDKRLKLPEILHEHDLEPEETIYIGDMQHDIEAAQAAGAHSCAVLTGYNSLNALRRAEPDIIVEHLGELKNLIERNELDARLGGSWSSVEHRLPISTVGALIYDEQDRVLMIRTHKWSDLWGIPGGKIKFGETAEFALRRELKEETNLEVGEIQFSMVQDCIRSEEFYRPEHFILLNYTCRRISDNEVVLNEEAQEFRWLSLEDALKLPLNQPTLRLIHHLQQQPRRG